MHRGRAPRGRIVFTHVIAALQSAARARTLGYRRSPLAPRRTKRPGRGGVTLRTSRLSGSNAWLIRHGGFESIFPDCRSVLQCDLHPLEEPAMTTEPFIDRDSIQQVFAAAKRNRAAYIRDNSAKAAGA